jgi:hypothetical protein
MKLRPIALSVLVSFMPIATASPVAWAQATAEDPTTAMARARFKEGVEYYDKGQFDLARAAFLQAYALKKHPAVLLNLAWSCLKGGHALEAERYFRQFLAEGKEITEHQRADANDGLTQSHAKLGRIEVAASAGTEITIDGEAVGAAPLPDAPFVEAGAHTVKMRGPDGAVDTQSVTVAAGEKSVVRFSRAVPPSAAPAPTPAPAPPPTETTAPAAAPAPTPAVQPTVVSPPSEQPHGSMSYVPMIVTGAVAVSAGVVAAIFGLVSKNDAQNNANTVGTQIANFEAMQGVRPAGCDNATLMRLGGDASNASTPRGMTASACKVWNDDNSNVNADATVANIALGVAIVAAAGTIVYGIVYAVNHHASAPTAALVPMVDASSGGLMVLGRF